MAQAGITLKLTPREFELIKASTKSLLDRQQEASHDPDKPHAERRALRADAVELTQLIESLSI